MSDIDLDVATALTSFHHPYEGHRHISTLRTRAQSHAAAPDVVGH
jgi:hypothetical protein